MSADQPYVNRKTFGYYIQGGRLNQAGTLEFKMLVEDDEDGVWTCLELDSHDVFGVDYSFSLVF